MTIAFTNCANCEEPTQTVQLDRDGHCPRCTNGRVSSPPPQRPATNVAKTSGKSFHTARLDRDKQIVSKIPITEHLRRIAVPPAPAVPAEAETP